MEKWEEVLKQIERLLDDKRTSGASMYTQFSFGPEIHVGVTTPQSFQEREESPVKDELEKLLDEALACSPVTEPCKRRLRSGVMVYYAFGGSTERIVGDLKDPSGGGVGPFVQEDFGQYEKGLLKANFGACADPGRMAEHFKEMGEWAEAWIAMYGEDEEISRMLVNEG